MQSFHSISVGIKYPLPNSCTCIHIFLVEGLWISSFLALNAKGDKLIGQSKRTTPPPPLFLKNFLSSKLVLLHLQKPS
jgi:hypothetical protein